MKKTVKLGIIGLGQRGDVMLDNPIIPMLSDGLEVVAVCDRLADRTAAAADKLEKAGAPRPFTTTDYRELLALPQLDAVYVAVSWEDHVEVAAAAIRAAPESTLSAARANDSAMVEHAP